MARDLLYIQLQWVHKINLGFMQRWKFHRIIVFWRSNPFSASVHRIVERSVPWDCQCGFKSLMLHHLMPQSIESDTWGGGIQAFDSCMWLLRYQIYRVWGCYLDFLLVGRKKKNWEERNLHMGIGQEPPLKTISLPVTIPKGNLFSTQLYLTTRTLELNNLHWQLHGK